VVKEVVKEGDKEGERERWGVQGEVVGEEYRYAEKEAGKLRYTSYVLLVFRSL
jgi:hypothetical protein